MPDAPGLELIAQEINGAHPGAVTETAHEHGRAVLIVDPAHLLGVLGWLRETEGQRYTFMSSLHAADYLPATPRFAMHYELLCRERIERISVKVLLADPAAGNGSSGELPRIDSCVGLFPGAEFPERETYDMFGIEFADHPDLRRILMPEDYVGWPQRRDFPMGGEPVLFTHNEIETPRWFE